MNVTVKKLPKSEMEVEGELEADVFEGYFGKALKKIGENIKLDGFRKGKVPENILLSKVGEMRVLEEMAQLALAEHYPKILADEKIDAIGAPQVSITKLARNNPLGFKIVIAILPEVTLPDYKAVAQKVTAGITESEKDFSVSDEEVERTIEDIRKSRAPKMHISEAHAHKEGEEHKHDEAKPKTKEELPEINDEFVQALGPFKDVADFKTKLKENIKLEKANAGKEKTRLKIIEKIIAETTLEVPEILVEAEIDKILYRMESDITAMGLKFEDYLKHLNKTVEDLRKEFRTDGEKKAKLGLILNEIAKAEKIVPDPEQVAKEVAQILEHYKEADPERAQIHAENVLTNEKIFQLLESQ